MPLTIILSLLLIVPILEIAVFIVIGSQIGVFSTLAMILVTAILGTILLRQQGLGILERLQAENRAGNDPGRDLVHGAMIMVAGVLLLTPGFVTDTIGFLLFVPRLRDTLWHFLKSRIQIVSTHQSGANDAQSGQRSEYRKANNGPVVDLNEDEFSAEPNPDTPWAGQDDKNKRTHD